LLIEREAVYDVVPVVIIDQMTVATILCAGAMFGELIVVVKEQVYSKDGVETKS